MIERTLVLIKPDGVQRKVTGEIITRFEKVGVKIIGMKMMWIDNDFSKKHYKEHVEKPFYPGLEAMITEGPVVAMVLEGVHVIEIIRKIVGATEPHKAAPGTIRGDYAHVSAEYANTKNMSVKNLVHASGTKQEAEAEIELWFKPEELHSYKTVHDVHTL
ncbi:nucleoside-diphosphate kinase [Euryarchaeota archaeon SM23-78]|nr:MAG: nucleoside-diphosphate kinase [Euryarchaeota archaeon SM23-78]MBW3000577.1 nucleoside-diphosphate kinase [Candidatus Woesearchaeota archaeon]